MNESLIDSVNTAIALGLTMPAPAGTHTYAALIPSSTPEDHLTTLELKLLSLHTTPETALKAIADEIRRIWTFDNNHYQRRNAPWVSQELYHEATLWKTKEVKEYTEEQYAQTLTNATIALKTLRALEKQWFATHDDYQTVATYLAKGFRGAMSFTNPEDLHEALIDGCLHPWIQEITIQP